MQAWNSITRQMTDFLVYFLLPGLSVLLPPAWSRAALARLSRNRWLLAEKSAAAWVTALNLSYPGEAWEWKTRRKLTVLWDVTDLDLMGSGRFRPLSAGI